MFKTVPKSKLDPLFSNKGRGGSMQSYLWYCIPASSACHWCGLRNDRTSTIYSKNWTNVALRTNKMIIFLLCFVLSKQDLSI